MFTSRLSLTLDISILSCAIRSQTAEIKLLNHRLLRENTFFLLSFLTFFTLIQFSNFLNLQNVELYTLYMMTIKVPSLFHLPKYKH